MLSGSGPISACSGVAGQDNSQPRICRDGPCESSVRGQKLSIELLRKSHVAGVVCRQVLPQVEDLREKGCVPVPLKCQIQIVPDCFLGPAHTNLTRAQPSPDRRRELDIANCRDDERDPFRANDIRDRCGTTRLQNEVNQRRGVGDDVQEASRSSRSRLIISAGVSDKITGLWRSIRSNTFSAGGRAISRRKSSVMKSVKV